MSTTPPYRNPSIPIDRRVRDLLRRMTVAEKIGQLAQPLSWQAWVRRDGRIEVSDEFQAVLSTGGAGILYGTLRADPWTGLTLRSGLSPAEAPLAVNAIQRVAVEQSRLGIPLLFAEECVQGVMALGSTVFPAGLPLGATWDAQLVEAIACAVRDEAAALGVSVALGPVLDLARDPRWSRTEECFGEDPHLAARMGLAMVRGIQSRTGRNGRSLIATLKHFAGHGDPEGGHNAAPAHVGPRELHEVLLAPFRQAVREGHAQALMASYNEVDGLPCSGNRALLTGVLRETWGFDGIVMSDCGSIEGLVEHGVAADAMDAATQAFTAGIDSVMAWPRDLAPLDIDQALKQGQLSLSTLDTMAARILRLKFRAGVFEHPYVSEGRATEVVGCDSHRVLCRQAARESLVLLENRRGLLPLKKSLRWIAVIGPNADTPENQFAHYVGPQPRGQVVTVLDGIRQAVSPKTKVRYAQGSGILKPVLGGLRLAAQAARGADVAVVVVGGSSARTYRDAHAETGASLARGAVENECGEGLDRSELHLPVCQQTLLETVKATGTPLVVVYVAGRPLNVNWAADHADALLLAWYPAQEGGDAVADVLFGDYNPSGRVPLSVPRSTGQLPVYYNHKPSVRKQPYIDEESGPRYAFGYGRSYTTFRYDRLRITPSVIQTRRGRATVSVRVTNTGRRAGDEVVQLYVTDTVASTTRPVRELKGFSRVHLKPGEDRRVAFTLSATDLAFLDREMRWTVEPGEFVIAVGGSSVAEVAGTLAVSMTVNQGKCT